MKYFMPDSQDLVDPSFDFDTERRSASRLRQRDDQYAHELFRERMLDGILISKGIVDGFGASGGRYTIAQRQRLLRVGAREFFRTESTAWAPIPFMGDCGAFTYVRESSPPYSVEEVSAFYVDCGVDLGISVDHVILEYNAGWDDAPTEVPATIQQRQAITLDLAQQFFAFHRSERLPFELIGVAQGWSPKSYAHAVRELQTMGFRHIALGGMVPLKTPEIVASLRGVAAVRRKDTRLHLLGVTRTDSLKEFASLGVTSFDSTSPLRQAFKDATDNFYAMDSEYTAIRIPQVEGNPSLQKMISSGRVAQEEARKLERLALLAMKRFDADEVKVRTVLGALQAYEDLYSPGDSHCEEYKRTLEDRPWKTCACDICRTLGHHVILFRGAERNRRRGLHNTWTFYRRVQREASAVPIPNAKSRRGARPRRLLKAASGEV